MIHKLCECYSLNISTFISITILFVILTASPLVLETASGIPLVNIAAPSAGGATRALTMNALKGITNTKRRCEITIISFSRSICRRGLATLIGVTGKPYPSCLSCHSHPIRPFRAPSPRGEGCDTRIPSSKKGGEAATRALNLEP